jgi:hypothetical protein
MTNWPGPGEKRSHDMSSLRVLYLQAVIGVRGELIEIVQVKE